MTQTFKQTEAELLKEIEEKRIQHNSFSKDHPIRSLCVELQVAEATLSGLRTGRNIVIADVEKMIDDDFKEQWIQYYKLDGGEIGVNEKMKINFERIKQKLQTLKDVGGRK